MLFNSYEFIFFFLPLTLAVYFILNKKRLTIGSNAWLLFASLIFYCWWNPVYLPVILVSILFNYTIGNLVAAPDEEAKTGKVVVSRKSLFIFGIAVNLLFLGFFKYTDFLIANVNWAMKTGIPQPRIMLPLGISFFTITQIAFLVDSYEGLVKERKFLNYALFVSFFPHLLAGPILHHKEMMPQFDQARNKVLNYRNLALGLFLFCIGLFKKVIIADDFVASVQAAFAAPSLTLLEAWMASLSYTFQLYCDFSGYTDMAIGIGLMFNIRLPENFNSPYKAVNIIEFWKRWHITLSNFITTYLYAPILRSFSRITFTNSLLAILIAMFISGVWHGAGWTFIIWGTLHGLALVVNHIWRKAKLKMPLPLAWLITFCFVNISFVFFRAKSVGQAVKVLKGMSGFNGIVLPAKWHGLEFLRDYGVRFDVGQLPSAGGVSFLKAVVNDRNMIVLLLLLVLVLAGKNSTAMARDFRPTFKNALFAAILAVTSILSLQKITEFIYFNF
ncbi:MAG TPA: MBOAT family O-acyltransferase [Geobacteraceae bacterium]|nr:MBOAT family O-acyltransferase [Geobacteraceae bacterium]